MRRSKPKGKAAAKGSAVAKGKAALKDREAPKDREALGRRGKPARGAVPKHQAARGDKSPSRAGPAPKLRAAAKGKAAPRTEVKSSKLPHLVGRLTVNPRGFGFVATELAGQDVFIPPNGLRDAMHGDRVEVEVWPSTRGFEGTVVAVQERWLRFITGTVFRAHRSFYLQADNPRLLGSWVVTGDIPSQVQPGMVVSAAILEYPRDRDGAAKVRIVDILGQPGATSVEVAKIKLQEGVVEMFPEAVQQEANDLPQTVRASDCQGREDLRDYDLVTIDPEDARDHDDALWATRTADGGFRLLVAIADVSHYVRVGSELDREALSRGCSIYLPDRAIPMLPHELSSGLASLVPDKDRLCLAVDMRLDARGKLQHHRIVEGVMRSRARLTYGGAAQALGLTEEPTPQPAAHRLLPLLKVLRELALLRRKRRQQRGTIEFDLPEPRVRLDAAGEPVDVYRSKQDPGVRQAYQLVEEMMLLANETVAEDLAKRGVPTIYRIHGKPLEDRLLLFVKLANALGFQVDAESATDPKALAQLSRSMHKHPQASILHFLLLRAMQQATYDIRNIGHFGLAAPEYLHFTSPIRRYPDMAVHRTVRAMLRGEAVVDQSVALETAQGELRRQALESSRLERRAIVVERQVLELYRTLLMGRHLGEEFEATITSVDAAGIRSSLDSPFVEVFTPIERLADRYELDELGLRLSGKFSGRSYTVGDRLRLRIEDANLGKRAVTAVPADVSEVAALDGGGAERRRSSSRGERGASRDVVRGSAPGASKRPVSSARRRGAAQSTSAVVATSTSTSKDKPRRSGQRRRRK